LTSSAQALGADPACVSAALVVLARCIVWQGLFYTGLGQRKRAAQLFSWSLNLLERPELAREDTRAERAFALWQLGVVTRLIDTPARAQNLLEQSLALYRALGDRWGMARVLIKLAEVVWQVGVRHTAKSLAAEGVELQRSLGDHQGTARSLIRLGGMTRSLGQSEEGVRLTRESVDISRQIGDSNLPLALMNLG
jgi:hypothetical protein